jgi:hypothetical protein
MSGAGTPKLERRLRLEGSARPGFLRAPGFDPVYSRTSLVAGYASLAAAFGRTAADFGGVNRTTGVAAFGGAATRVRLLSRLDPA